jgi:hypothetical protein
MLILDCGRRKSPQRRIVIPTGVEESVLLISEGFLCCGWNDGGLTDFSDAGGMTGGLTDFSASVEMTGGGVWGFFDAGGMMRFILSLGT